MANDDDRTCLAAELQPLLTKVRALYQDAHKHNERITAWSDCSCGHCRTEDRSGADAAVALLESALLVACILLEKSTACDCSEFVSTYQ